jgi:hypothetical protein
MTTLHIEHTITDYATWQTAFDQFAEMRALAGVRGQRVQQPIEDDHYVVIDLDFDTVELARTFLAFLQEHVWSAPAVSPALVGAPRTAILRPGTPAATSAPNSPLSLGTNPPSQPVLAGIIVSSRSPDSQGLTNTKV